jgi:adenosylhomocysteine nucleosidase
MKNMMKPRSIGLVAALPEETRPFLRIAGSHFVEKLGRFNLYHFTINSKPVCMVESGMGPANAEKATRFLIDFASPGVIVNFGFAGALSPGISVGDIVLADRLLSLHDNMFSEQQGIAAVETEHYAGILESAGVQFFRAAFITTGKTTAKRELAERLPQGIVKAAAEMETAAVAQIAHRERIPLVAIRTISDGFNEELGFTLAQFCDNQMNLRIWRVLLTVAKKPWIIPQLARLSGNTRMAGDRLARALLIHCQQTLTVTVPSREQSASSAPAALRRRLGSP